MVRIYAVYRGRNGSLGYKTGKGYRFNVRGNTLVPSKVDGPIVPIPYSNIEKFLENWYQIDVYSIEVDS